MKLKMFSCIVAKGSKYTKPHMRGSAALYKSVLFSSTSTLRRFYSE